MRKWGVLLLLLFLTNRAYANPVIYPTDQIGYLLFLSVASCVEVSLVTLILMFFDIYPKPAFFTLFIGNLVIYFAVFLPMLQSMSSLLLVETIVVVLDGIMIKIVSLLGAFQMDTFKPLKWVYALIIAAIGNLVSYYIGAVMTA